MNVSTKYLEDIGDTVKDWDGSCLELADRLLHLYEDANLVYLDNLEGYDILSNGGYYWSYHAVIELDGKIHDAWHPEIVLPLEGYIKEVFPDQELGVLLHGNQQYVFDIKDNKIKRYRSL